MKYKILHITPDFNYVCGRSRLVYYYLDYFSNSSGFETHFITNGGDSLDRLNNLPKLKFKTLKFSKGCKNIFYYQSFYNTLKKYISDNKINIIHTHHRFPEYVSVKIDREISIRTITTAHSYVKRFGQASFKSEKIISVSNSISNYLSVNFKIDKEKIVTLYNPVDTMKHINPRLSNTAKKEMNISLDKKIILFVGRISRDKAYDTLLNAYSFVRKKNKNVILIINGRFEDKKLKRNLFDDIILIAPQENINHLYSIADLVVLPSRIDPFPFVMIEAGSFKKPFIGGNTGGIAEFIEAGKNGLLIDPENPNQLAEKIIYLLENPKIAETMGENLYEKVNRNCNYNNYFNQVEKIYNSLLTSR